MNIKLEKEFINSLELRLKLHHFQKNEVVLTGRIHYVNFLLNIDGINYNLFIRLLPKNSEFEVYFKVEYTTLSEITGQLDSLPKYKWTFTEKLIDFLEPENSNWFNNTTSLNNEKIDLQNEDDIEKLVDYIEGKYVKIIFDRIIPKINSLDKLNILLNDYDLVYDKENNEPKMYVLSGGMIFQSISALILNTIYKNPKREELIKMYSWLYNIINDDEDIDKIMMGKVLDFVANKTR
jgi:hypothetical protein